MFPVVNIESVQPNQPPWTVSCVCQQWRTVAIHTGELWSLIELDLDQRYQNKELAKNRVFRLGLSLVRSNGHDLSIRLHGEKSVPGVSTILQILLPTAPCWKRLSAFLPSSSFRHFSVCKGYLNRLDTLYISSRQPGIESLDTFQLAPSLKVLGTCQPWDRLGAYTRFFAPSSGITTLISAGPNMHTYECLKRLPHIQKLTLFYRGLIGEAAKPISLRRVTFLHLISWHFSSASQVLSVTDMYSHLILPSLRHLTITFIESESPDQISFPVVTNPDSCPIEALSCIYLCSSSQEACTQLGDELIKFLRRTPKLMGLGVLTGSGMRPTWSMAQ